MTTLLDTDWVHLGFVRGPGYAERLAAPDSQRARCRAVIDDAGGVPGPSAQDDRRREVELV